MLKPLYARAVAESILTRPRTKKAWSPKIGGNDIELARWSYHQPVRNGTRVVLVTRTQTAMFTCGVAQVVTFKPVSHFTITTELVFHGTRFFVKSLRVCFSIS